MNTFPIQTSFIGGEISPRLHGRSDSDFYKYGLEKCDNFKVTPQGSLIKRPGTEYIGQSAGSNPDGSRLFTFTRNRANDVVVEINNQRMVLLTASGHQVISGINGEIITDPNFKTGLAQWETFGGIVPKVTPTLGVSLVQANLANITANFGGITQGVEVRPNSTHQLSLTLEHMNTFEPEDIFVRPPGGGIIPFNVSRHVLHPEQYADTPANIFVKVGTSRNSSNRFNERIELANVGDIIQFETEFESQDDTLLYITISAGPGGVASGFVNTIFVSNIVLNGGYTTEATNVPVEFRTPWAPDRLADLQVDLDSAKGLMFFFERSQPPQVLRHNIELDTWLFEPFPFELDNPPQWDESTGYPGVGAIHDGRLWVGSTVQDPSSLWASRVWEYEDFVTVDPEDLTPDDPMSFALSTPGFIQWMTNLKKLLIGTGVGEIVGRSQGPVITSEDFAFPEQSAWGSVPIEPIKIGNNVAFVTSDRAHIRELYDLGDNFNSFMSRDITLVAEHLFTNRIRDISFAPLPNFQVNALMNDGTLSVGTYIVELEINAWYTHEFGAKVVSMTATNDNEGSTLWMVIDRGEQGLTIETINPGGFEGYLFDHYVVGIYDRITHIASGFNSLIGQTVSVILVNEELFLKDLVLDSNTQYQSHPDVLIEADGTVVLEDWAVGTPIMGFNYTATAKTLPPETGGNRAGSAQLSKRRWPEIAVRLQNSALPKLNGQRPAPRRDDDLMDYSPPLYTGDVTVEDLDWDRGQIEIIQDLPLRTEILALFVNVSTKSV